MTARILGSTMIILTIIIMIDDRLVLWYTY